ncbi:TetR/AcrR family transcriptional regulator [Cytobacillus gottheilii]|uniref:TetR/AcrR family transcriptional regulator n=1 Tax=Cytobacillus gottheilii TaxID=859144 RepID=UPI000834CD28|nr:TetR-like C-terminal domain-containing protein [Cytobacillus gottheilii]
MTKQDMRIVKTKNALHHALLDLLDEKLLEDISVTEICRTANINRGTFYLHYAQIEDLFEEYFKEITGDLSRAYQEPYRFVSVLKVSRLNSSTIRIFHHIQKYEHFYRIVFSKKVPLMYYYLLFEEINRLLLQEADPKMPEDLNAQIHCAYQANAIIGIIIEWYKSDFSYSADYLNDQLVKILNLSHRPS